MLKGKICVVTGGGSGIGGGLCEKFAREGGVVVVSDLNLDAAQKMAKSVNGTAIRCDVSKENDIKELVSSVIKKYGRIDVFCSNAGILLAGKPPSPPPSSPSSSNSSLATCPPPSSPSSSATSPSPSFSVDGGLDQHTTQQWDLIWKVNVLSHVIAFQALLPHFRAQKGGVFLITASAAGLMSQIGNASYATTKHAAVGLAEAIAITHGDEGIKVFCLCPQAVDTHMYQQASHSVKKNPAGVDGVVTPEHVANAVVDAFSKNRFLILPHPQVHTYMQRKAADYNRWIDGMQKWRRAML